MEQPLMLQSDCVDCPYYDGFGQCIQYGNITEEIISKCEFNKEDKVMKANEALEKIFVCIPDDDIVGTASTQKGFPHQFVTEEFIRKDAFIEKACEFLNDRIKHDSIDYPMATVHLIDDFKNYMKGE